MNDKRIKNQNRETELGQTESVRVTNLNDVKIKNQTRDTKLGQTESVRVNDKNKNEDELDRMKVLAVKENVVRKPEELDRMKGLATNKIKSVIKK